MVVDRPEALAPEPLREARPAPAGATFGVEEEFHLVDPVGYRLTRSPALAAAVLARESGPHLHAEITTTQLEAVTGICTSLSGLRAELVTTRAEAAGAAARAGVRIMASSTHPFDSWQQQDITAAPRYRRWSSGGPGWRCSRTSAAATCMSASLIWRRRSR